MKCRIICVLEALMIVVELVLWWLSIMSSFYGSTEVVRAITILYALIAILLIVYHMSKEKNLKKFCFYFVLVELVQIIPTSIVLLLKSLL